MVVNGGDLITGPQVKPHYHKFITIIQCHVVLAIPAGFNFDS
jgi:hypothetical protein